jgi:hypothetical protein
MELNNGIGITIPGKSWMYGSNAFEKVKQNEYGPTSIMTGKDLL